MYKRQPLVSGFVPERAVNDRACEVLAGLAFGLESGTDFTAGISGVILVHNVCLLYTSTVIYGYLGNEARDQWLVDPEAADVVKRIFAMTIEGYGPYQIASKMKEEKILIPSAYLAQHGEGVNKNKTFKDVYGWGSSTICNLLEKREYLGPVSYTHLDVYKRQVGDYEKPHPAVTVHQ